MAMFGEIQENLAIGPGQVVRRNAAGTGFETINTSAAPGATQAILVTDASGAVTVFLKDVDGWIATADTWTYASATTFTIAGDLTAKYIPGTKLKLTQTTVKFFYVVSSVFAGGNTTVTFTGGSDYSLANASITSPFYSYEDNPQGFPQWFNYTPTWTGVSPAPTVIARFNVVGRMVTAVISPTVAGTGTLTTFQATAPIVSTNIAGYGWHAPCICNDNGVTLTNWGRADMVGNSNAITFYTSAATGAWTASGSRYVAVTIQYEI